jgi:hypothetical protein
MLLALKLAGLVAFLGGPLYCSDRLRGLIDSDLAFAVGFAPLGCVLLGALSLHDVDERWDRWVVRVGLVGAALLGAQNVWALYGLALAHDSQNPRLHALGVLVGTGVSIAYARLARGSLRGALPPAAAWRLSARVGDWLALGITSAGALAGLFLLLSGRMANPDEAISVVILFGGMAAFMALQLRAARRFERRVSSAPLQLPADGSLWPSRRRVLQGFCALLVWSAALCWFGRGFPPAFRWIMALLALFGAVGAVLALLRIIPPGRLHLESDALRVRTWRYTFVLPWDAIAALSVRELFGNRLLDVHLYDPALARAQPDSATARAQAALARNEAWSGAHLSLAAQLYDVDLHALLDELERRARAAQGA